MTDAISAERIELTYSDGTRAVDGVDLHVGEGEFFGFLGPNGAGKTTTIEMLVTLLEPTGGNVTVNGFDPVTESRQVRRSVGYMAQETSVDKELTARENIQFACEAYGVPPDDEHIDTLLSLADLADVADERPRTFSGGMKKRLDVTTALVHNPPIVFLDEPTTGLDPNARTRLWEYFREINAQGTTLFLTTQYLEEADRLCDRLAVIDTGEIIATGPPAALKHEIGGDILDVELADASGDTLERANELIADLTVFTDATVQHTETGLSVASSQVRSHGLDLLVALRDAGFEITGFNVRSPTLDDVFFALTGEPVDKETSPSSHTLDSEVAQ